MLSCQAGPSTPVMSKPPKDRYTVFEAVNEDLKEIFIGKTRLPMFEAIELLRRSPPPALRHWAMNRWIFFRSLEFGLEREAARELIARRAGGIPEGWRSILTDERK